MRLSSGSLNGFAAKPECDENLKCKGKKGPPNHGGGVATMRERSKATIIKFKALAEMHGFEVAGKSDCHHGYRPASMCRVLYMTVSGAFSIGLSQEPALYVIETRFLVRLQALLTSLQVRSSLHPSPPSIFPP